MIGTHELLNAFDAIGARARITHVGLDFRVQRGVPGLEVAVQQDKEGPYFDVRVNALRVVDLQVVEIDGEDRYLVLAADDWGDDMDAPPLVFRCGVEFDGLYVDPVTEFSSEE